MFRKLLSISNSFLKIELLQNKLSPSFVFLSYETVFRPCKLTISGDGELINKFVIRKFQ